MTAPVNTIVDTIPLPNTVYRVLHVGGALYTAGRLLQRIDPATKQVTQLAPHTFAWDYAFVDLHRPVDVPPGTVGEGEPDRRFYVAVDGAQIGQLTPYFGDQFDVFELAPPGPPFYNFSSVLGSNSGTQLYLFETNRFEIAIVDPVAFGFPRIVGSIPLGKYVTSMVISPDDRFIYAAHLFDNAVSAIDTSTTPATVRTVPVDKGPIGLVLSADGSRLFVSKWGYSGNPTPFGDNTGWLSEYDTTTWHGGGLYTGYRSAGVVINAAETRAYVSNAGDGTISVVDITSGLVYLETISGFVYPGRMCFSHDQRHLYVCQDGGIAVVAV